MKRIILLGFPKSGTSSFQSLLKSINYKTIHWILNKKDYPLIYQQILDDGYVLTEFEKKKEGILLGNIIRFNKNNNNKLLKYLNDFSLTEISCSSDQDNAYWPQLFDYKRLINENKDAYFILNWREFDLWYDSMVRWNKYNERLVNHCKKVEEKFETYELDNYYKLFKIHSIHYINTVSYFKNNPKLKMCIYDIMRDNVSKLEDFLNIKNLNLKEMFILPTNNYNLNNNFIFIEEKDEYNVEVIGGLCNRLRLVISLKSLFPNKIFNIYWIANNACPGFFLDYFEPIKNINFIKVKPNNLKIDIKSCYRIIGKFDLKYLILKPYLKEKIDKIIKENFKNEPYISCHIRRTDHFECFKNKGKTTDLKHFENFIEYNEKSNLFIATDNLNIQENLYTKYNNRIKYINFIKLSDNLRKTTLEMSIIDLYICTKSDKFMGTYWSSFSNIINRLRNYYFNN